MDLDHLVASEFRYGEVYTLVVDFEIYIFALWCGFYGFAGGERSYGDMEVVEGDDVFDGVEVEAPSFGDVMEEVEDVAIESLLFVEGDDE